MADKFSHLFNRIVILSVAKDLGIASSTIFLALHGCNTAPQVAGSSDSQTASAHQEAGETSRDSEPVHENNETESDEVVPPTNIAGAYLTCAVESTGEGNRYGCAVLDQKQQRVDDQHLQFHALQGFTDQWIDLSFERVDGQAAGHGWHVMTASTNLPINKIKARLNIAMAEQEMVMDFNKPRGKPCSSKKGRAGLEMHGACWMLGREGETCRKVCEKDRYIDDVMWELFTEGGVEAACSDILRTLTGRPVIQFTIGPASDDELRSCYHHSGKSTASILLHGADDDFTEDRRAVCGCKMGDGSKLAGDEYQFPWFEAMLEFISRAGDE